MEKRKVYAIQHNVTKKMYIGTSKNIESRYLHHITQLRANKHTVEDMQEDFNKYGEDYSVFVLDEINTYNDKYKEYEWMARYNTTERGVGYNYKDPVNYINPFRNKIPFVEGLPEGTRESKRDELHEYVDSLTEGQVIYVHTLLTKLFFESGEKQG